MTTMDSSTPTDRVQRDDEKVWLDVPSFHPGQFASSVHGAQARILECIGEDLTYDDLVCYGAFAFRANWHKTGCPSGGHPCCGYRCIENSTRAIPWRMKIYENFPGTKRTDEERQTFEAEVCAAIKSSIDRGIPVHYGSEEDGLIIGYGDDGKRWWCIHPYQKGGNEAFWHDEAKGFGGGKWPWAVVIWTQPKSAEKRIAPRELTIAALKQAVDMWHIEKKGDYYCGDAAYEHWLAWLRDCEAGKVDLSKAGGSLQGNGWCYDVTNQTRPIAARWLTKRAELFEGDAREHLLEAAEQYGKISEVLASGYECTWHLTPGAKKWTSELRQEQIKRLEVVRELDRAAIGEIAKALETME